MEAELESDWIAANKRMVVAYAWEQARIHTVYRALTVLVSVYVCWPDMMVA